MSLHDGDIRAYFFRNELRNHILLLAHMKTEMGGSATAVAVASPVRTRSTSISIVKACASMMASVQPPRRWRASDARSNHEARAAVPRAVTALVIQSVMSGTKSP
jgi:hypothetical protein